MPTNWPVVLRRGEDGWIVAECPLIPGCVTQGQTREEALDNIIEAIALCLESGDVTPPTNAEVVTVRVAA